MVKVSAIQMCSSHLVDDNLAQAKLHIDKAAKEGAALIVLPEMFAIIGRTENEKFGAKETFGAGKIQDFLQKMARSNKVWLVGGTIPITTQDKNRVRAACLVFDDNGVFKARYDKIHLFDVDVSPTEQHRESMSIEPGNELVLVETPFGKLGLGVCYDLRFPEMFRYLFVKGMELLALPAAFTAKTGAAHWEILTRSRAIENFCYVIAAAQAGVHTNGRHTFGHSCIIEPWGSIVSCLTQDECDITTAAMDSEEQKKLRKSFPIREHQRIFFEFSKSLLIRDDKL